MKIDPAELAGILAHARAVHARLSRTLAGVSDVSSSSSKSGLLLAGLELETMARENISDALDEVCTGRFEKVRSVDDARQLIEWIATAVNRKLVPTERPLYRTWVTPFSNQIGPHEIGPAMEEFLRVFHSRLESLKDGTEDPVRIAAWVERRLNWEIHPFADGCGRCAFVLAAGLLAWCGISYPAFASRAEYMAAIGNSSLEAWIAEYALHIPAGKTGLE